MFRYMILYSWHGERFQVTGREYRTLRGARRKLHALRANGWNAWIEVAGTGVTR